MSHQSEPTCATCGKPFRRRAEEQIYCGPSCLPSPASGWSVGRQGVPQTKGRAKPPRWSAREQETLRQSAGLSVGEIVERLRAEGFERTRLAVTRRCLASNVAMARGGPHWKDRELELVRQSAGLPARVIVERLRAAGFERTLDAVRSRCSAEKVTLCVSPCWRLVPRPQPRARGVSPQREISPSIDWKGIMRIIRTVPDGQALAISLPPGVPARRFTKALYAISKQAGVPLSARLTEDSFVVWPRQRNNEQPRT